MTRQLLFFAFFSFSSGIFAQAETFIHCFENDSIVIEKTAEIISGDTLIKSYHHHLTYYDTEWNVDFNYYFYNDSVFSKYNGKYYMIGDNNAQVGDIWHPLRYYTDSYTDSAGSEDCGILMSLKVESISQLNLNGTMTNYFHLKYIDNGEETDDEFGFIANIGVTEGGPYYNLKQPNACVFIYDIPQPLFRSYTNDTTTYTENICPFIDDSGLEEVSVANNYISLQEQQLIVKNVDADFTVSIYDLAGRKMLETHDKTIDVSNLKGMYLINYESENTQFTMKYYF